ncbi:nitroreductase family protein [Devosia oryziradicis]|uniref:Nitroreductase family protein n=1 Tax=Devosia oryziradicis TaxID=2801335 RepID=A0ABX7BU28_9HYPH|nr:nitroreductase family protein [Devosia oryziradicis]QQR35431.1 nitroreductase family protein [Devosia oryziradicis]
MNIKKLVPKGIRVALRPLRVAADLLPSYYYDFVRYLRFSSTGTEYRSKENLRSRITERFHNVEKGLSLPSPRPGFGKDKLPDLLTYIEYYLQNFGADDFIKVPVTVLARYADFNKRVDLVDYPHRDRIERLIQVVGAHEASGEYGTRPVVASDVRSVTENVSLDFFLSRHTVRQFAGQDVDISDVEWATRAAIKSPTVCNRQNTRVYFTLEREKIHSLLEIQGGAKGFADQVRGLAVITTRLSNFWGAGERHQAWVDGGLFSMSFLLALHARGLGAVSLNWSKGAAKDIELRRALPMRDDEAVIMLVGFGHLREQFSVASSWRPPVDDLLVHLR